MKFNGFEDFYRNAKLIKREYDKLDITHKEIYKMYLYSNTFIKLSLLDKMWEYLNEPCGSFYYVSYRMLGTYL